MGLIYSWLFILGRFGILAEKVPYRELAEEVHQFLSLDVIVLDEYLHAVAVFLAAHVLMCREVRLNVESPLLPHIQVTSRLIAWTA